MHADEASDPATRTVLVVGANGFLGGFIVAALREHGYRVLRGVRPAGRPLREDERACDLARMTKPDDWREVLDGADAVVNASGILREVGSQRFETIHVAAPLALARACIDRGIDRFVQISALGLPEDGEFIASKHRFDEALRQLSLQTVVLRPSVVYAAAGSYGGTSLLRALSGFPGAQVLPGDGRWLIQPVAAEDLGALTALALEAPPGIYEVGGPEPMPLRDYQREWRRWLGISGMREIRVPEILVTLQVGIFERLGSGPVGDTMWRMLRRGNVTSPDAHVRLRDAFGFVPRALAQMLASRPSQVQDRWHAQLYFLGPALRTCMVALWLLSAVAGWLTPTADIERLIAESPLQGIEPVTLARAAAVFDLVLAILLLIGWRPRLVLVLMAISVAAYTLVFGIALPALWLEPLGGLAKNLAVMPALAVLWVLSDRR